MRYLLLALIALFWGCSSPNNVAGGTGVGNPSGVGAITTVSMVAKDGPASTQRSATNLEIVDMNGIVYNVTSLKISVTSISWETDIDYEDVDVEIDPRFTIDGKELVLTGEYSFDLVTGLLEDDSALDVSLPDGSYKMVRYYLEENRSVPSVIIEGTVIKDNETLDFEFSMPLTIEMKFTPDDIGRPIYLGNADKELSLQYELRNWFEYSDPFEFATVASGKIIIDAETVNVGKDLSAIRNAIRASGVLVITE